MATAEAISPPAGFFEKLERSAFSPGWAKREPQMWAEPRRRFVPTVWRYAEALASLTEAASFVSTEFAERRNLILVNPVEGNIYPTCRNLVAAYQLVLPGETARSHRHSPNALRLVLDATAGVYTLVDGIQVDMAAGDVVLTPQWHWHGHANYSDSPAFWIDFLDVPLVQNLENMFFEHHPETLEAVRGKEPASRLRYQGDLLRQRAEAEGDYPFGDGQLPTIVLHAISLREGRRSAERRCVENNIYAVTSGRIIVEVETLGRVEMTRGDVIVVPAWYQFALEGGLGGGFCIRVTDAPVFEKLGFRDVQLS